MTVTQLIAKLMLYEGSCQVCICDDCGDLVLRVITDEPNPDTGYKDIAIGSD
jgi:hypothetical protein